MDLSEEVSMASRGLFLLDLPKGSTLNFHFKLKIRL